MSRRKKPMLMARAMMPMMMSTMMTTTTTVKTVVTKMKTAVKMAMKKPRKPNTGIERPFYSLTIDCNERHSRCPRPVQRGGSCLN